MTLARIDTELVRAGLIKRMRRMFKCLRHEKFVVALISDKGQVIRCRAMFRGDAARVEVSISAVARAALSRGASALVVAHNHPTGSAAPSEGDIRLTRRMRLAFAMVGIQLLDHLIFAEGAMHSMQASGPWDAPLDEFAALVEGRAAFTSAPTTGTAYLTARKD